MFSSLKTFGLKGRMIRWLVVSGAIILPSCQFPAVRSPEKAPDLPPGFNFTNGSDSYSKNFANSADSASKMGNPKDTQPKTDGSKQDKPDGSKKDNPETLPKPGEIKPDQSSPDKGSGKETGPSTISSVNKSVSLDKSNSNKANGPELIPVSYKKPLQDPPDSANQKSGQDDSKPAANPPGQEKTKSGATTTDPASKDSSAGGNPSNQSQTKTGSTTADKKANNNANVNPNPVDNPENTSRLGIDEFYNDTMLTALIRQGLENNRELKILDQEYLIASNEVLARKGTYLPFVTAGGGLGLERPSLYTPLGAVENQLEVLPGVHFPNPLANFQLGLNLFWELDIWRKLRNARDAAQQRFIAAGEKRNFYITQLIAEIAENYYKLMALDNRLETLDLIIELQEKSLKVAVAKKEAGRGTLLAIQRFEAEVSKNQSEKLIVKQNIIETENRINFLLNRYPQPVERLSQFFMGLEIHALKVGLPSQLLQNRADIRQAEREIAAAGLDVKSARANFYPTLAIDGGVGFEAFNPRYLFMPDAIVANVAGNMVAPLINKKAIQAEYMTASAKQLQAVYNYQRVILNAFTEVINRVAMVENYRKSLEIKKQQLEFLEASVESASKLFQNAKAEYIEVLFAQRDMVDAKMMLIDIKREQLAAAVNAYQALGGGYNIVPLPAPVIPPSLLHKSTWNLAGNWNIFHDWKWFHDPTWN